MCGDLTLFGKVDVGISFCVFSFFHTTHIHTPHMKHAYHTLIENEGANSHTDLLVSERARDTLSEKKKYGDRGKSVIRNDDDKTDKARIRKDLLSAWRRLKTPIVCIVFIFLFFPPSLVYSFAKFHS